MTVLAARAPGKINLCLFLGPVRPDGRHELVSVVQSVSQADELVLEPVRGGRSATGSNPAVDRAPAASSAPRGARAAAPADVVECPGVEGPNLAALALASFRARTGWDAPPQRLHIVKRVPVAGGMGGGSADAAATLRLAAAAAGVEDEPLLMELATSLGADVPAQIRPGRALVEGAGERVRRLPDAERAAILIVPSPERLSTAAVYAEADRLGLPRDPQGLARARSAVESSLTQRDGLPPELLVNELEPAARALCPPIGETLQAVRDLGADVAMVSGSGPTVLGLFEGPEGADVARTAALALAGRHPGTVAVTPVSGEFGRPSPPPLDVAPAPA
jgi:4-diphosphocytidyl-2-C-methyl-D-erythritol kinase